MGASNFRLSSFYAPAADGKGSTYRLMLENRSGKPISGFRLGFSGPGRISEGAPVRGGRIVEQLSSWCELEAADGFVLASGERWDCDVERLDFAMHHWTDGATGAVLTLEDGSREFVEVVPTQREGEPGRRWRGVVELESSAPSEPWAIVPWPQRVELQASQPAPIGFALEPSEATGRSAAEAFRRLAEALSPGWGLVRGQDEDGFSVRLEPEEGLGAEAYRIRFDSGEATVRASTSTGFLYGLVTLGQMARGARLQPGTFAFPAHGLIEDEPAMGWRGCHLDVARQFYGSGEIRQFLHLLAWNKLNRFHWHLSDDEAWRVEIEAYPQLTGIGAWRGAGMALPPLLGSPGWRSGGFYTQGVVRELVAEAATLGIEVVPEIDVPGHCHALLQALPTLRDQGESGTYYSIQGFPNNCLNPAVPAVYEALERIFGELCELFPSRYFHVGADEVPAEAWSGSPMAEALGRELSVSGAAPLQAHFLRRIQTMLRARGKITGAWEEAAQGGGIDKADCYLVGWHTVEANQKLAAQGYDVVVSPGQAYYLDMANGTEWAEPGAHWAGWSSPEKTYAFDPAAGWSQAERDRLLGVQACIWSEPMTDRGVFERLVFPRLSAIAETSWTAPERKSWERFATAAGLMPSLYGIAEEEVS